jgi:hypothetical protein
MNASGAGQFFLSPVTVAHRQYEALRAFYVDGLPAEEIAEAFGYTTSAFYSLVRDFKKQLELSPDQNPFFRQRSAGRKPKDTTGDIDQLILSLRKKYLSVPDIKAVLDVHRCDVSERYVYNVIKRDGFDRLPRRTTEVKMQAAAAVKIEAPPAAMLDFLPETFSSQNALGILCLLPYIQRHRLDRLIERSLYPQTVALHRLSSILSFVALKLSNVRRYTADDAWCMDRGLGLFALLNVLPKAAWFSSYSHRITRKMNRAFLKALHTTWHKAGLLSDTANLDFTSVPYWGDPSHLENNWSGTRHKALPSILAVLAQEPDSGIITYSDTSVRHRNKSKVVLEFLDFYCADRKTPLSYLVFDSKFTTYENLARLDPKVKFLTIRRRGKNIVNELDALPCSAWKTLRVAAADGKRRTLRVNDSSVILPDYSTTKPMRQIAITGHGKIKPALLITNDHESAVEVLVRKYARRWLVEKEISEQIEFFHLNKLSSSMVIKVDFDLTMSVLAHNLLRLLAADLQGYEHCADQTIFTKFLQNSGTVDISPDQVVVRLKKKRNLPALLTAMESFHAHNIHALGNRTLVIDAESTT